MQLQLFWCEVWTHKVLTSTKWGKHKETILDTYKAITRPVREYASTIWSPNASETNIDELQIVQNTDIRIADRMHTWHQTHSTYTTRLTYYQYTNTYNFTHHK